MSGFTPKARGGGRKKANRSSYLKLIWRQCGAHGSSHSPSTNRNRDVANVNATAGRCKPFLATVPAGFNQLLEDRCIGAHHFNPGTFSRGKVGGDANGFKRQ